jgi:hypothetical protein
MMRRKIAADLAALMLVAPVLLAVVGGIDSSMHQKRKTKDDHEFA